jgi:hypothetical protein
VRRCALALLGLMPLWAAAQPGEAEKALLQRQQYQEEFSLRLRHSQQQLDPTLTPRERRDLDERQQGERRRQEATHGDQRRRQMELQQVLPQLPEHRQRHELERQRAEFARERSE